MQRAAEMMGEQDAVLLRQAEHAHRQPPDGAGDAVAIEIERRHVRRADVLRHVHLHAVDDGEEILALEAEGFDGGDVILQPRRRMALIQRVDIVAPCCSAASRSSRGPSELAMSSTCRQKL